MLANARARAANFVINDCRGRHFFKVLLVRLMDRLSNIIRVRRFLGSYNKIISITNPIGLSAFGRRRRALIATFNRRESNAFNGFNRHRITFLTISNVKRTEELYPFFLSGGRLIHLNELQLVFIGTPYGNVTNFFGSERSTQDLFLVNDNDQFRRAATYVRIRANFQRIRNCLMVRTAIQLVNVRYNKDDVICASTNDCPGFLAKLFNSLNRALGRALIVIRAGNTIMNLYANDRNYSNDEEIDRQINNEGNDYRTNGQREDRRRELCASTPFLFNRVRLHAIRLIRARSVASRVGRMLHLLNVNRTTNRRCGRRRVRWSFRGRFLFGIVQRVTFVIFGQMAGVLGLTRVQVALRGVVWDI